MPLKEWQYFEGGINPLKPDGKYMYHLIEGQQNFNFVRIVPLCVDCEFYGRWRLFFGNGV